MPETPDIPNTPSTPGNYSASLLTQDFYQYALYDEYMKNINYYLLNSKKSSIVVKFFHQNIDKSSNYNNETSIHNIEKFNETIYDVFEFCPTMDNQAISYQVGRSDNRLGYDINSANTITIFQMSEPLPDDLFTFYSEDREIFRVTGVTYIQSVHKNLKLYQLTYENAPVVKASIDNYQINETYYFNNEFDLWYASQYYTNFVGLIQNKDNYRSIIKKYYDSFVCNFDDKINNLSKFSPEQKDIVNKTIHILKILGRVDLPVLLEYKHDLDPYGYPIGITYDETYIPDINYVPVDPNSPGYVYAPYAGLIKHELLETVYKLYELYKPFIEISIGKEPR